MRRRAMNAGFLAAGLALAVSAIGAGTASGQDTEPADGQDKPQFGERMEVEEVLLDVLVTDKKGNAVVGLTPADFTVEEDGEPVELTGATFYSSSELLGDPAELEARGADIDVQPRDRYFILLIEDQRKHSTGSINLVSQQIRAARDARGWVAGTLAPADWVAVLSYDFKLKLHADFTRDPAELDAAIEAAVSGREGGNWPSRREGAEDRPSLAQYMPSGNDLRDETTRMYGALEVIAESAGHLPGRKNLLFFTIGLGETDRRGIYQREQRYWPPMVRALNDANVAVYTLDLTPTEVRHSLEGSLNDLADETGGRYYYNFATYRAPLDEIAQENGGYYLLSYRAEHPAGEDGFQEVRVRVADPSLQVRTREGYGF